MSEGGRPRESTGCAFGDEACPSFAPGPAGDALRVDLEILLEAVAFAERLAEGIEPATANERRLLAAVRQVVAGAAGLVS